MTAAELWKQMMELFAQTEYAELRAAFIEGGETDNAGANEMTRFLSESIDPGMVIDFSNYNGLVPDQEQFRHGQQGFIDTWRVFLEPWSGFEIAEVEIEELRLGAGPDLGGLEAQGRG